MGRTKEGSYLHTHVKKKKHISTRVHTHRHTHTSTFDSIIIEPTSHESGSQERTAYAAFDVSLGFPIFLECGAIQEKGRFSGGLAKSYQENNLASVNGYYRFATGFWM